MMSRIVYDAEPAAFKARKFFNLCFAAYQRRCCGSDLGSANLGGHFCWGKAEPESIRFLKRIHRRAVPCASV